MGESSELSMIIYVSAVLIAIILASLSVVIHYEALNLLNRLSNRLQSHRERIVYVMLGLLVTHVIEIWMYGGVYAVLEPWAAMGEFVMQTANPVWFDHVYYSAMVYTTVGFGDITPTGALRMITATEALVGLSLITWSASFTFFLMQKIWR